MASDRVTVQQPIRFGDGYELDLRLRRLRRGRHVVKLERIPVDILLIEHKDEIVTREEIAARVWGKGVFLDTDNSIRGAIRKLRQALKDDAESPRFIQTVTGQGYRFIAPVTFPAEEDGTATAEPEALGLRPVQEQSDRTMEKTPADEIGRTGKKWQTRKWLFAGAVSLLLLA